jgi:hypothetical protein
MASYKQNTNSPSQQPSYRHKYYASPSPSFIPRPSFISMSSFRPIPSIRSIPSSVKYEPSNQPTFSARPTPTIFVIPVNMGPNLNNSDQITNQESTIITPSVIGLIIVISLVCIIYIYLKLKQIFRSQKEKKEPVDVLPFYRNYSNNSSPITSPRENSPTLYNRKSNSYNILNSENI